MVRSKESSVCWLILRISYLFHSSHFRRDQKAKLNVKPAEFLEAGYAAYS